MSISRDDWLQALTAADSLGDPDALTTDELAVLLGICRTATRRRVKKLVTNGGAVASRKRITDSMGRSQIVTAYKLVKETSHVSDVTVRPEHPGRRRRQ